MQLLSLNSVARGFYEINVALLLRC